MSSHNGDVVVDDDDDDDVILVEGSAIKSKGKRGFIDLAQDDDDDVDNSSLKPLSSSSSSSSWIANVASETARRRKRQRILNDAQLARKLQAEEEARHAEAVREQHVQARMQAIAAAAAARTSAPAPIEHFGDGVRRSTRLGSGSGVNETKSKGKGKGRGKGKGKGKGQRSRKGSGKAPASPEKPPMQQGIERSSDVFDDLNVVARKVKDMSTGKIGLSATARTELLFLLFTCPGPEEWAGEWSLPLVSETSVVMPGVVTKPLAQRWRILYEKDPDAGGRSDATLWDAATAFASDLDVAYSKLGMDNCGGGNGSSVRERKGNRQPRATATATRTDRIQALLSALPAHLCAAKRAREETQKVAVSRAEGDEQAGNEKRRYVAGGDGTDQKVSSSRSKEVDDGKGRAGSVKERTESRDKGTLITFTDSDSGDEIEIIEGSRADKKMVNGGGSASSSSSGSDGALANVPITAFRHYLRAWLVHQRGELKQQIDDIKSIEDEQEEAEAEDNQKRKKAQAERDATEAEGEGKGKGERNASIAKRQDPKNLGLRCNICRLIDI